MNYIVNENIVSGQLLFLVWLHSNTWKTWLHCHINATGEHGTHIYLVQVLEQKIANESIKTGFCEWSWSITALPTADANNSGASRPSTNKQGHQCAYNNVIIVPNPISIEKFSILLLNILLNNKNTNNFNLISAKQQMQFLSMWSRWWWDQADRTAIWNREAAQAELLIHINHAVGCQMLLLRTVQYPAVCLQQVRPFCFLWGSLVELSISPAAAFYQCMCVSSQKTQLNREQLPSWLFTKRALFYDVTKGTDPDCDQACCSSSLSLLSPSLF